MTESFVTGLLKEACFERRYVHDCILALTEDLSDDQLFWRSGSHAPSIGFHIWHLARWEDLDVHQVTGGAQIWHEQALGESWDFPAALGEGDTGTKMGREAAERLVLPDRAALLDYARSAFTAVDELLDGLQPDAAQSNEPALIHLIYGLSHVSRHLGMMEAIRGVLGFPGTATR